METAHPATDDRSAHTDERVDGAARSTGRSTTTRRPRSRSRRRGLAFASGALRLVSWTMARTITPFFVILPIAVIPEAATRPSGAGAARIVPVVLLAAAVVALNVFLYRWAWRLAERADPLSPHPKAARSYRGTKPRWSATGPGRTPERGPFFGGTYARDWVIGTAVVWLVAGAAVVLSINVEPTVPYLAFIPPAAALAAVGIVDRHSRRPGRTASRDEGWKTRSRDWADHA